MKKECVFAEHGKRRCSALKVYACEGCRFFKTEDEYNAGRAFAEHLLARKGLRPVVIFGDGGGIMTVERVDNDVY